MISALRRVCLAWALASLCARAQAVDFSTATFRGQRITVCRVDVKKERLQLFLRDDSGQPLKSFQGVNQWLSKLGRKLVFGMNAGMYQPDLSPVGLYVSEGRQAKPLNLANGAGNFCLKPNGVFALTASGAHVVESSRYPRVRGKVLLATQSGPMLVINGKIHPAFKAGSALRKIRNGVGVPSPGVAIFAISEDPVNLYDFALFFRDVLHCRNALFLDGNVSSLDAPKLGRNDSWRDLGPMIGVTE